MRQRPGEATEAIPVPSYATGSVRPPGWVLADRYTVLDRLGSGGMADVFRAHDEQLDRDVAVKVFRTPVDEPGNAHAPERRENELHALAQLTHPNLITLYDANIDGASPAFLVTELVIGPNLAARIAEGPIPEDLARVIGIQIADALAYVHASGMVHRDVKPANILLGTDGPDPETATVRARLSDFGIVRVLDDARMTAAEFTLGTASYIAPEQARGADVGPPADVYALALVLLETLTGRRCFEGPMHEAVAARLVRGPDVPPGLPQPWPGLLVAMTAADPAQRPSAAQVAESLRTSAAPAFVPVPLGAPISAPMVAAPLAAAPTAATVVTGPISTGLPVAAPVADPAGPPPFGSPPPGRARRPRRTAVLLTVAALAFVAIIATAALLMFKPSPHSTGPAATNTTAPTTSAGNGAGGQSGTGSHRHGGSAPAAGPVAAVSDSSGGTRSGSRSNSGAPSSGAKSSAHSSPAHSSAPAGGPHPRSSSGRPAPSSSHQRPSSSASKSAPGGGHTSSAPSSSPVTSASAPTSSAAAAPTGGAAPSGGAVGSGQSG